MAYTYVKKSSFDRPGWLSTEDAATYFGMLRSTIRRWRIAGRINAAKIPNSKFWIVEVASVEQYILQKSIRKEDREIGMEERFWALVDVGAPDACWPWLGFRGKKGHGRIKGTGRANEMSHRVAWRLKNGPIPEGAFICHHCDNPPCCNPTHLYAGTNISNMKDMRDRGRSRVGMWNVNAKLRDDYVKQIRGLHARGKTLVQLSRRYKVSTSTIKSVVSRKHWRHVK